MVKFEISKSIAESVILLGVGIIAGILSVWVNWFLKTGSLIGLSLDYIFIGIVAIVIGLYFHKYPKFCEVKNVTKKNSERSEEGISNERSELLSPRRSEERI